MKNMSKGKVQMVDADAVQPAPINPVVVPSAPTADTQYIMLETEGQRRDLAPDQFTDYQARVEQFQQASAVKNANDTRKFILDADEEAVILSNTPSKVKANQLTNRISAENRVTKNEVVEYDSSDLKYGHSPLESADHNPTDYSVPKADHTKEYTFGSDSYETTEYKFES